MILRRSKPKKLKLADIGVMLLITFMMAEIGIRIAGYKDADGQFYFLKYRLQPHQLPMARTEEAVRAYQASETHFNIYDPLLGWTLAPNSTTANGDYRSNAGGLRAPREYTMEPQEGVLRIAAFGDSFTFGEQVPYEGTWEYQLEERLRERSIEAEVLNFGVGGYGMDQAYLRWQQIGYQYQPDIVIFGFLQSDMRRNVNIFPQLKGWTDASFTKPRFVLESGELRLINSPTIPQQDIAGTIMSLEDSPLSAYEYYYPQPSSEEHWWLYSRLVGLGIAIIESRTGHARAYNQPGLYSLEGEVGPLSLAIIDAFQRDVEARDISFLVVYYPEYHDLVYLRKGFPLPYQEVFSQLEQSPAFVDSPPYFDAPDLRSYFISVPGHYSPEGNAAIAESLLPRILQIVESEEW